MAERRIGVKEKVQYMPESVDSAYSLSSGGMGIHLNAVTVFAAGQELSDWAKSSVRTFGSNYLVNPYVFGWTEQHDFFRDFGPHDTTPRNEAHLRLIQGAKEEYHRLERSQVRVILAGEEAVATLGDIESTLTDPNEFRKLLIRAASRGLVEYDTSTSPDVEIADSSFWLARSLSKAGIECSEQFWTLLDDISFLDRFRARTLQAAIYKLGAMLALTDQLTFDAQALGHPFAASYRPTKSAGKWEENWQKLFGRPMPGLEGLYQEAHAVLVANSDPKDPLVGHLHPLTSLPQLTA